MKKIKLNKLVLPAGTADQIMVNQALQDVKKYVTKHPNMSAFTRHKPHLLMPSIYDLVFDQSIQNAVGEFIGEPFFMWFSVLFLKMKNSKGFVPWHYDEYFWATKSTKGCTVWVALDDVEKDMGPMIFCDQPISDFVHGVEMSRNNILARGNFSTFTPPKDANIYDACLKKGQFSIHATDIWHSSRPNQSNKDPSYIVVDEHLGQAVTLLFCDEVFIEYLFAFLLFRFFDILKPFPINLIDDYKMSINEEFGMCHINVSIDYDCANQYASDNRGWNIPTSGLFITQMGQNIYLSQYYDAMICGQVDYSILGNMTLTFWVTGLFEDELMPDVGDMNLDGNINVVDVVVLVNSILGIG